VKAHPPFARAWLAQRRAAATNLAVLAAEELRALGEEEALRRADALLSMVRPEELSEERRTSSGFVEQQRRFHGTAR
jgi:hypothetical protein